MKKKSIIIVLLAAALLMTALSGCALKDESSAPTIYVAWSDNMQTYSYISTLKTVEETGAKAVVLDQARSADLNYDENGMLTDAKDDHGILTSDNAKKVKLNTWQNSNVPEIMQGVDCVIFPGGKDICPTLYYDEQDWHGIESDTDYSAERDVSDYILLSYCLENDIPVLAICRGMQMLSVVSGAEMMQDVPTWYLEQGIETQPVHRDPDRQLFMAHSVQILSHDSLLYQIMGKDFLDGVPSWHHQAVASVDNTRLVVTALAETDGKYLIEAVERPDKTFCIGVQFHPEVAVKKYADSEEDAAVFMDYDSAMALFNALSAAAKK